MKYERVFSDYIEAHQINKFNFEDVLKDIGYVDFFNDITTKCLGFPKDDFKKTKRVTSTLVYLPDEVKEKAILNIDMLYVSQLYLGIMTNGHIKYNYPNYKQFLESLMVLRKSYKSQMDLKCNDKLFVMNVLIKTYMNVVYGMLDKNESVISCDIDNPREYITETSKRVMLTVASFFLNKSKPIYYIDTDEIFVPTMNAETIGILKEYFKRECSEYINMDISDVMLEDDNVDVIAYIIGKKKMIIGKNDKLKIKGMPISNNDKKILLQNKKFFGRNYKDIFPEYAIW